MNRKYLQIFVVVILVLLGISLWFGTKSFKNRQTPRPKLRGFLVKEVTITLDSNGFTPNTITIKTNTPVRWINKSGKSQTVNSDNYPTNQLHRELNFGVFSNGSSVTYTFKTTGIYGYHNQFNHTQTGKVVVVN